MEISCLLRFFGEEKRLKISKLIKGLCNGDKSEGRENKRSENNDASDDMKDQRLQIQALIFL